VQIKLGSRSKRNAIFFCYSQITYHHSLSENTASITILAAASRFRAIVVEENVLKVAQRFNAGLS
jgi:hypothetical protein